MSRRRLGFALLLAACASLTAACGEPAGTAKPAPDAQAPDVQAPADVASGVAPEVVDVDPMPSGPNRFEGIENSTDEEDAAWREDRDAGALALRVVDAGTSEAVVGCSYSGFRFAFTRENVDRRLHVEVDGIEPPEALGGTQRFPLAEGWWRVRVFVDGYRSTWTPRFEVRKGEATDLTLRVLRLNRLKVRVLDPDGEPLAKGALAIHTGDYRAAFSIRDGIGDQRLPLDSLTLSVQHHFDGMDAFRKQSWPVTLRYGETTEMTIRLERP